jgi:hypothetical protein
MVRLIQSEDLISRGDPVEVGGICLVPGLRALAIC